MSSSDVSEVIASAKRYFRHQAELGSDEWYVSHHPPAAASPTRTLADLWEQVKECQRCHLWKTRTHVVFGSGDEEADVAFVGEAPGRDEDLHGKPFVGRAGQLLTRIIEAIGFRRENVYIGNILKCRPPENRDPLPDEIDTCLPILDAQLQVLRPAMICALGRIAAQTLLQTNAPLSRLRGHVHDLRGVKVVVTYHPAALLRNPHLKRPTWDDVQLLRREYDRCK